MENYLRFVQMKQRIRGLIEVAAWPQLLDLVERAVHKESLSAWEYSFAACEAVGGSVEAALPGAAAIFCSLASIHLVDDMLDEDPVGDYRSLGSGNAANMALALQAAAHRLLIDVVCDPETRADLQASLAGMALATAYGQNLDTEKLQSEDDYWRVVGAKTPPLFGAAMYLGARLGGAPAATAKRLERVGGLMARLVQVSDDLHDALQAPAGADWRRPGNNLAILFALTAAHPERDEFRHLLERVKEDAALARAQQILVRSGAMSYCALKLLHFAQEARQELVGLLLADPRPIERLMDSQIQPLHRLFERAGVEEPAALALE